MSDVFVFGVAVFSSLFPCESPCKAIPKTPTASGLVSEAIRTGDFVQLHSLQAAQFNGTTGLVKSWDEGELRWLVELQNGDGNSAQELLLKPLNLRRIADPESVHPNDDTANNKHADMSLPEHLHSAVSARDAALDELSTVKAQTAEVIQRYEQQQEQLNAF